MSPSAPSSDETRWIEAARSGDLEAFNALIRRYQDRLYHIAYRIMGDHDSAADALQEALIAAFRGIRGFRGGSFLAWLTRIVTNACYDELRRRRRRPQASLEALFVVDQGPEAEMLLPPVEGPEFYAERQELADWIHRAIQSLPEDQRVVLVLSDIEGYSYEEIAEILRVPLGTVKSRLSRARARVRDFLLAHRELLPGTIRPS
ncbi:ECF RNA polymerase sigma factor SigE [Candidatus Thermoflexus japonica]|uniref:ECF RNA polymerase sigma factor SigE n=1 Tax=Candidatus Thermoflexus japonica TaxID=2035417 RepID=A0A2H5Y5W0_9CHLR|nr:ECF RNA polymerase sigma factor SigE [Candidatus Thermoflexus japonica]